MLRRAEKRHWRLLRGLASIFKFIYTSLLHNVMKSVRNRTASFRCVSGSRDGYGFLKVFDELRLGYVRSG